MTRGWQCLGTQVLPTCKGRRRRLCRAGRRLCWRLCRSQAKCQELLDPLAKAASLELRGGSGERCRSRCSLADRAQSNNLYPGSSPRTILSFSTWCSSRRPQHKSSTKKLYFCGRARLGTSWSGCPSGLLLYPTAGAQLPARERLYCTSSHLANVPAKFLLALLGESLTKDMLWASPQRACLHSHPSTWPQEPLTVGCLSSTVCHSCKWVPGGLRE